MVNSGSSSSNNDHHNGHRVSNGEQYRSSAAYSPSTPPPPPLVLPTTAATTAVSYIGLIEEFAAKLILEVFGGGGAIWGFSEVCGLRTQEHESARFWRSVAVSIAAVFGARWFRQLLLAIASLSDHPNEDNNHARTRKAIENNGSPASGHNNSIGSISPLGIQLSNFFCGDQGDTLVESDETSSFLDDEEDMFLPIALSYDESTALATSPRSPKSQ